MIPQSRLHLLQFANRCGKMALGVKVAALNEAGIDMSTARTSSVSRSKNDWHWADVTVRLQDAGLKS